MIDAITRERIKIHAQGPGSPYFMVAQEQLETVANVLRDRGISHWVDEDVISIDDEPAVAIVNLGRGADVPRVQAVLDTI